MRNLEGTGIKGTWPGRWEIKKFEDEREILESNMVHQKHSINIHTD
jgi:hypothetical protein